MSSSDSSKLSRTLIWTSLILAVILVVGVLIGARVMMNRAMDRPVPVGPVEAPLADSAECSSLLESMPETVAGHQRREIAEPAPEGVAAYATTSNERITVRCGVDLPFQYSELSITEDHGEVEWMRIDDPTPGIELSTWYTVNRTPVVAVTSEDGENPVTEVSEAIAALPEDNPEPQPVPLIHLEPAEEDAADVCAPLMDALPQELTGGRSLITVEGREDMAAWVTEGLEPIVIRCGVAPPPNYEAGEQLTQIDDIPWFEDAQLVNGSTASHMYALGRATDIALSVPQDAASETLPEIGRVITAHTPEQ